MDTKQSDVIIIGAGASGLIAANIAVERGKTVILLEKKSQMGLKLRITGKGHCNITNNCDKQSFLSHISNKDFFLPAFERFSNKDLIDFFSKRNVSMVVERYLKVLKPMHDQFIEPTKRYADLIIPQGGENIKGIAILCKYIEGLVPQE